MGKSLMDNTNTDPPPKSSNKECSLNQDYIMNSPGVMTRSQLKRLDKIIPRRVNYNESDVPDSTSQDGTASTSQESPPLKKIKASVESENKISKPKTNRNLSTPSKESEVINSSRSSEIDCESKRAIKNRLSLKNTPSSKYVNDFETYSIKRNLRSSKYGLTPNIEEVSYLQKENEINSNDSDASNTDTFIRRSFLKARKSLLETEHKVNTSNSAALKVKRLSLRSGDTCSKEGSVNTSELLLTTEPKVDRLNSSAIKLKRLSLKSDKESTNNVSVNAGQLEENSPKSLLKTENKVNTLDSPIVKLNRLSLKSCKESSSKDVNINTCELKEGMFPNNTTSKKDRSPSVSAQSPLDVDSSNSLKKQPFIPPIENQNNTPLRLNWFASHEEGEQNSKSNSPQKSSFPTKKIKSPKSCKILSAVDNTEVSENRTISSPNENTLEDSKTVTPKFNSNVSNNKIDVLSPNKIKSHKIDCGVDSQDNNTNPLGYKKMMKSNIDVTRSAVNGGNFLTHSSSDSKKKTMKKYNKNVEARSPSSNGTVSLETNVLSGLQHKTEVSTATDSLKSSEFKTNEPNCCMSMIVANKLEPTSEENDSILFTSPNHNSTKSQNPTLSFCSEKIEDCNIAEVQHFTDKLNINTQAKMKTKKNKHIKSNSDDTLNDRSSEKTKEVKDRNENIFSDTTKRGSSSITEPQLEDNESIEWKSVHSDGELLYLNSKHKPKKRGGSTQALIKNIVQDSQRKQEKSSRSSVNLFKNKNLHLSTSNEKIKLIKKSDTCDQPIRLTGKNSAIKTDEHDEIPTHTADNLNSLPRSCTEISDNFDSDSDAETRKAIKHNAEVRIYKSLSNSESDCRLVHHAKQRSGSDSGSAPEDVPFEIGLKRALTAIKNAKEGIQHDNLRKKQQRKEKLDRFKQQKEEKLNRLKESLACKEDASCSSSESCETTYEQDGFIVTSINKKKKKKRVKASSNNKVENKVSVLKRLSSDILERLPEQIPTKKIHEDDPTEKHRECASKSKRKIKGDSNKYKLKVDTDYIPLKNQAATHFGVVSLNKMASSTMSLAKRAEQFRNNMLYGQRITRVPAKSIADYRLKLQAAGKDKFVRTTNY